MMKDIRLALGESFFGSFDRLPRELLKQARGFIAQFPTRAKAGDYTFESISAAACEHYRLVDLSAQCSVIVYCQEEEGVYLLLWAGSREHAEIWARRHRCEINPRTNSVQVFETGLDDVAAGLVPQAAPEQEAESGQALFGAFRADDLLEIGVPEDHLALLRSVRSKAELLRCQPLFSPEVFESLVWLADGEAIDTVKQTYAEPRLSQEDEAVASETGQDQAVGAEEATPDLGPAAKSESALQDKQGHHDWARVLASPATQRCFRVVSNSDDLEHILDMSLESWRVFLHPLQSKLVHKKALSPTLVRGTAGTGKTVVALHRAVELVNRSDWDPEQKLLFTTFTRNLALDLQALLRQMCTPEAFERIEVVNLDAWVARFLKRHQISSQIVYPDHGLYQECWKRALTLQDLTLPFSESFYHEEFSRVVLPQEITNEAGYLKANRKGRGRAISRGDKKKIWPVFEEMRNQLGQMRNQSGQQGLMTIDDACYAALHLLSDNPALVNYGAVVVDETQDLGEAALRLLAVVARCGDGQLAGVLSPEPRIFLVGDGHQRIYPRVATISACGINIRGNRSSRLRITYRTTEEIRQSATRVLTGYAFNDMDDGQESELGDLSNRHGQAPVLHVARDYQSESIWIMSNIDRLLELKDDAGERLYRSGDICIATRTQKDADSYQAALRSADHQVYTISREREDDTGIEGIRLATMHRIKGLEFKVVFIANAAAGMVPLEKEAFDSEDDSDRALHLLTERSLFYVATTRARDLLYISCSGEPGEFMRLLMKAAG
ncbi:MAG: UvrD-helicase domain-containing protein [Succinivibrio sp.]|nr:UvrD-helicase domain-containing protein [Succinivibrio sp.]